VAIEAVGNIFSHGALTARGPGAAPVAPAAHERDRAELSALKGRIGGQTKDR
jgi:hypothetical protein